MMSPLYNAVQEHQSYGPAINNQTELTETEGMITAGRGGHKRIHHADVVTGVYNECTAFPSSSEHVYPKHFTCRRPFSPLSGTACPIQRRLFGTSISCRNRQGDDNSGNRLGHRTLPVPFDQSCSRLQANQMVCRASFHI